MTAETVYRMAVDMANRRDDLAALAWRRDDWFEHKQRAELMHRLALGALQLRLKALEGSPESRG